MNNKRFAWLILWIAFGLATLQAQPGKSRFSPEEFKQKLEGHITQEARFTPEEAKAFFPLFHEMRAKQRKLMGQIMKLKTQEFPADSKEDAYVKAINEITKLKTESADIEADYYKRLCKAVSPRKVYDAMKAEDKFHRDILKRANNREKRPANPQAPHKDGRKQ